MSDQHFPSVLQLERLIQILLDYRRAQCLKHTETFSVDVKQRYGYENNNYVTLAI